MIANQNGKNFLGEEGNYKELTNSEVKDEIGAVLSMWNKFLAAQNENLVEGTDYFIHTRNLYEVVKRLDKRRTYYYVFHKINNICEYKEIGILCYWINTLKPFMVVNEKSSVYSCPNEMFSLYIILSMLAKIYKKANPTKDFKLPDERTVQDYVYNFKYCDLSREATIIFVETLAKSYGIGMETKLTLDEYEE